VFGVVLLSILVQGLSMTLLARRLGVIGGREAMTMYEAARVRRQLVREALAEIRRLRDGHYVEPQVLDTVEAEYRQRAAAAEAQLDKVELDRGRLLGEELAETRRRLLLRERRQLTEARQRGVIGDAAFNQLLVDIDARLLGRDDDITQHHDRNPQED